MSEVLDEFNRRRELLRAQESAAVLVQANAGVSPEEAARAERFARTNKAFAKQAAARALANNRVAETEDHAQSMRIAVTRAPQVGDWLRVNASRAALARGSEGNLADYAQSIDRANNPQGFRARAQMFIHEFLGGENQQGGNFWRDDLGDPGRLLDALQQGAGNAAAGFAGEAQALLTKDIDPGYGNLSLNDAAQALGFNPARFARQRAEAWERYAESQRPESSGDAGATILEGVSQLPLTGIGLVMAYASGGASAGVLLGANAQGSSYRSGLEEGLDNDAAFAFGARDGVVEAVTEAIPFGTLLKATGGSFLARFVQSAFQDVAGEQMATLLQDLNAFLTIEEGQGKTWADFANERGDAAFETLIASSVGTSAMGVASGAVELAASRLGRRASAVAPVESTERFFNALNSLAAANEVLKRDPQSFEEFVGMASEGSAATEVFVEAEALLNVLSQSGLTAEEGYGALEITPEDLQLAAERGEDITMSVAQYAARVAPTALGESLLPHLRLDPDHMSRTQAETFLQSAQEEFQQEADRALGEGVEAEARKTSRQRVEDAMFEQLNATRRFTKEVNRTYAAVVAAFFDVQSAKLGISAEELSARFQLEVQSTAVAKPSYDQARPTINVGLKESDTLGTGDVSIEEVRTALSAIGVDIMSEEVQPSDTEPTAVITLSRELTPEEMMRLSEELRQDAVTQFASGRGALVGPRSESWGDFDPARFVLPGGTRLPAPTPLGDGRRFRDFFAGITSGESGAPTRVNDVRLFDTSSIAEYESEYVQHMGKFDNHIGASIPGFREVQLAVGAALVETMPQNGRMLDIAGSEGALAKAIAAKRPDVQTVVLDPNPAMRDTFASVSTVPGATFVMEAFTDTPPTPGEVLWDEDGTPIFGYTPDGQFDVVHEAMGFQFIHNNRALQVARVKELMTPNGIAIFEEKFVPGEGLSREEWQQNEVVKDQFKLQYFTAQAIAEKQATILENTNEEATVGMNDLMVSPGEFEAVLVGNFAHVAQFWDSGNFKGYVGSDSKEALDKFLGALIDTDTPFSTVDTPRTVRAETFNQSAVGIQYLPMGVKGSGPGGRVLNWDLGEALTLRHMAKYERALDPTDPEDYEIALDAILEDYVDQSAQADAGLSWYSDDIAEAIRVTERILPELELPVRRDIFLTAVALLSPQQGPVDNWDNAIHAMTGYSIKGKFALEKPNGQQFGVASHATGLQLFQHLIDTKGEIGALVWLADEHTGREMEAVRRASGLFKNKADNYLPKEMNFTEKKLGAYLFGPKVGDFMLNSTGLDQNAVTVDLWMARTYNRVIGRLTDVNEKRRQEGGLADQMRGKAEREIVKRLVRDAAKEVGIAPSAMQAALWYFEQRLYRRHGIQSGSTSFSGAAREAAQSRNIAIDGTAAEGSAARSAEAPVADPDEGVVYQQDPVTNPLRAFRRESLYPTTATRHADGTVYTDAPGWYPDRLAKIAEQIGATAVVAVEAGDTRLSEGVPLWHNRPPVNPDGTVTLHHWGPKGIKTTDPTQWGRDGGLSKSERQSVFSSALRRTYFGIASGQPGGYIIEFPGRTQYEARVPAERLYDIAADPDGLKKGDSVSALEKRVKDAGYAGYWSNNDQLGLVAVVFEPVDVALAGAQPLFQDAVFFSALERTLENTTTQKASAQQWEATLKKTPGVKEDELNWTGLLDFLEMQEGPITREQLLEVVRGAGLRVDEVVLGGTSGARLEALMREGFDRDEAEGIIAEGADDVEGVSTQFSSWTTDPSNDTYRELLITLPVGTGRNPNRAPSTHWDTDGVLAHARFMDKTDTDGKKVLFIEEVQSDWHQKGRDQGYEAAVDPAELDRLNAAYLAADEAQTKAQRAWERAYLAALSELPIAEQDIVWSPTNWNVAQQKLAVAIVNSEGDTVSPEAKAALGSTYSALTTAALRRSEARIAQLNVTNSDGIPNAPFRTDWPALVMKRMIRWAAEHGYERIAWTTGEQQAARYNLSSAVGIISHDGMFDSEGYLIRMDSRAAFTLQENQLGEVKEQRVGGRVALRMTEKQMREAFGNDIAQKLVDGEQGDVFEGDDLRVGGEGMKQFYDQNLVNITNKLIKKYGAKVGPVRVVKPRMEEIAATPAALRADADALAGVDDRMAEALYARADEIDAETSISQLQPGFDITPALADAAMGGFPLFQRERAPRGQIAFGKGVAKNPNVITLLRGADLSTFVHELGHFFFEVTNHLANEAGAPAAIVADRDALLRYLGVESATEWANRTPEQRRDGHERIARSFEAYLFEGRAPSVELRGVFGKLRKWMLAVYRSISQLNVNLTDEVRGVFDRMLASEDEIAEAQADAQMAPLFSSKPEGMSQVDWEEYQRLNSEATEEANKQLESRSLRDMRYAGKAVAREIKRLQGEVAEQRAEVREEVATEFSKRPVYRAIQLFRKGILDGTQFESEAKLNTGLVRELLQLDDAPLPDALRGMTKEDGVHPQQMAELFGYTSADHLLRDILFAAPFNEAVEAETDSRMRERYGELNTPEEVEEAARAAVHNEVRGRFTATELAALQNAPGKKRVLAAAARKLAQNTIGRLRIRDIRPSQYEAAERRAARAAQKAGATDLVEAVRQKRNQLLQFNLARAAHEAREETEKAREYLLKFGKKGTRANIDTAFLDQIDQLLERFDLRQVSNKEADRRRDLRSWVEKMQEEGFEPALDPETLADIGRKPWRELTVEEMREVLDAVKSIEHLGRLTKKLLTAIDKADLDTAAGEMGEAVRVNAVRTVDPVVGAKTWWELVKSGAADFFMMHRKLANMAYIFDGNKYGGVFWERFIRPMNAAGDRENTMTKEANLRLATLFAPIATENTSRREYIPSINKSLSLEDRLMVALNMGNAANLQRLMSGDRWSYEQVQDIIAPLKAHHWDFVENVWREIDSWWPQIAAKQLRTTGIAPEKVEAQPFQVQVEGQIRYIPGGYFPIKYDPDRSSKAEADDAAEILKQMTRGLYTSAQTRRGHTKERVAEVNNRPLRKDFGVIFGHVNQVIHDLAWHEYLIDANRLLRHGSVDSAVREHYGPEALRWMRKALEDIAIGDIPAQNAFEKSVRHLRTGVSISAMGWSVWTSLLQPTGLSQSMSRIGSRWVVKGVGGMFSSPSKMNAKLAWIYSVSPFMRSRGDTMQREINEVRNHIGPKSPLRRAVDKVVPEGVSSLVADSFFVLITKAQLVADAPTWLGQYQKSLEEGKDPDTAVAIADQAVIDSQGGGTTKDLAAIQRGGELQKLFTNFYSYFSSTFNLLSDRTNQLRKVGVKDLPFYIVDVSLLTIVPATIASLMYTVLRTEDDDEDEILQRVAVDNLAYLTGLMVGLREVSGTLSGIAGYQGPAGARFFAELGRLGKQVSQGETDEALVRATNSTAGILLHYPATQLDRTTRGILAIAEGDAPLTAAVFGPPVGQ